jgi:hypothetical protein
MMKRLVKLYAIALYLLTIPVFFIGGMFFTQITGAAEGQGLAGGAIVVVNGLIFSGLALVVSLLAAYFVPRKLILITNSLLLALLVVSIGYVGWKLAGHARQETETLQEPAKNITAPVSKVFTVYEEMETNLPLVETGLGFYKPDFFSQDVIYFYGNPNFEKSVFEHFPIDSIVFARQENGGFNIVYAPPWLQPHHLKLDYDIFYFKAVSLGHEFIEVVVNTTTHKTMYVDRFKGALIFWPEFLLGANSITFPAGLEQALKVKPLDHASNVQPKDHYLMKPILVQGEWVKVQLHDYQLRNISSGWLRWQYEGHLLIKYALLS